MRVNYTSVILARNLRKFLEKSSVIQLSVKNQGSSDCHTVLFMRFILDKHLREKLYDREVGGFYASLFLK